jgi:hypothetical protein
METCYLYEVAAIERPTQAAAEQGELAKVVLAPTTVLANGRSAAIAAAAALIKTTYEPQRTTWIVRKFVGDNL